ncbi:hypothetical protein Bbelb_102400 [Branchiostoma belcheri]|nr:hypothetical protein Bbelb_102400 [Branchiostoma belcheri]
MAVSPTHPGGQVRDMCQLTSPGKETATLSPPLTVGPSWYRPTPSLTSPVLGSGGGHTCACVCGQWNMHLNIHPNERALVPYGGNEIQAIGLLWPQDNVVSTCGLQTPPPCPNNPHAHQRSAQVTCQHPTT